MSLLLSQPIEIFIVIINNLTEYDAGQLCKTCTHLIKLEKVVINRVIRQFYCYENALFNLIQKPRHFQKLVDTVDIPIQPSMINQNKLLAKIKDYNSVNHVSYLLIYECIFGNWLNLYTLLNTWCNDICYSFTGSSKSFMFKTYLAVLSPLELTVCQMTKRFILTSKLSSSEKKQIIMSCTPHSPKLLDLVVLNSTILDEDLWWVFGQNIPNTTFKEILRVKSIDPLDIANLIVKLCTSDKNTTINILHLDWYTPEQMQGIAGFSDMMLNDIAKYETISDYYVYKAIKKGFIIISPQLVNSTILNFLNCDSTVVIMIQKSQHVPSNCFIEIVKCLTSTQLEELISDSSIRKQFGDLCYSQMTTIIRKKLFCLYKVMNLKTLDFQTLKEITLYYPLAFKQLTGVQREKLWLMFSQVERKTVQDVFFETRTVIVPEMCDLVVINRLLNPVGETYSRQTLSLQAHTTLLKEHENFVRQSLKSVLCLDLDSNTVERIFRFVFKVSEFVIMRSDLMTVPRILLELDRI